MVSPKTLSQGEGSGGRAVYPFDPARAVVWYGAALLLILTLFQLEQEVVLEVFRPEATARRVTVGFLNGLGLVLFLESLWLLTMTRASARHAIFFRWGLPLSHGLAAAFALVAHQFMLKTGTELDLTVLLYALSRLGQLTGLIASGFDQGLAVRALLLGCVLSLAHVRGLSPGKPPMRPWSEKGGMVMGAVLLASGPVFGLAASPGNTDEFEDLLSQIASGKLAQEQPGPFYAPPVITSAPVRRPNIVMLILESMRYDSISGLSTPSDRRTPHLDRLAEEGIVFENVYTTVPHTSKALVGLLCGMYPVPVMEIVEAESSALPLRCLPHLLGELGYRTAFFQTALGSFENRPGLLRNLGFGHWQVQEDYDRQGFAQTGYFGMDEFAMLKPALAWAGKGTDQPFFLVLLTVSTHHPYQAPGRPQPDAAEAVEAYRAAVRHVDDFFGALRKGLEQRGLWRDALVIVVGDHGEAFGEHRRFQHDAVPYEEVLRTPLIMSGPLRSGLPRRVGGLRSHLDLLPTILEILGVGWTGTLPGRSLFSTGGHERIIAWCWYPRRCLTTRSRTFKLVYHYRLRGPEVFDLEKDPAERENLAEQVGRETIRELLSGAAAVQHLVSTWYEVEDTRTALR
jgi:hypothetical protein